MRRFEKISVLKHDIPLPERKTAKSAGYDISIIHPHVLNLMVEQGLSMDEAWNIVKEKGDTTFFLPHGQENFLFPTGLKASMEDGEVLMLFIRSSVGVKQHITLSNQVAVIDADYYNNPDNEGHIFVPLDIPKRPIPGPNPYHPLFVDNEHDQDRYLEFDGPTLRICQGIFLDYKTTDDDTASGKRQGGLGSTGA